MSGGVPRSGSVSRCEPAYRYSAGGRWRKRNSIDRVVCEVKFLTLFVRCHCTRIVLWNLSLVTCPRDSKSHIGEYADKRSFCNPAASRRLLQTLVDRQEVHHHRLLLVPVRIPWGNTRTIGKQSYNSCRWRRIFPTSLTGVYKNFVRWKLLDGLPVLTSDLSMAYTPLAYSVQTAHREISTYRRRQMPADPHPVRPGPLPQTTGNSASTSLSPLCICSFFSPTQELCDSNPGVKASRCSQQGNRSPLHQDFYCFTERNHGRFWVGLPWDPKSGPCSFALSGKRAFMAISGGPRLPGDSPLSMTWQVRQLPWVRRMQLLFLFRYCWPHRRH